MGDRGCQLIGRDVIDGVSNQTASVSAYSGTLYRLDFGTESALRKRSQFYVIPYERSAYAVASIDPVQSVAFEDQCADPTWSEG